MKRFMIVLMLLFSLSYGFGNKGGIEAATATSLTAQATYKIIATDVRAKASNDIYRVTVTVKSGKTYDLRYNSKGNYSIVLAGIKKSERITFKAYNIKNKVVKQNTISVK